MTLFKNFPTHWLVFAAGLLTSLWAAQEVWREIDEDGAARFEYAVDQIALKMRERLESQELILRSGAALFAVSEHVNRKHWQTFVSALRADEIVPGTQGIGFAQLILPMELDRHVSENWTWHG